MNELEYLKEHHEICERVIGSANLFLFHKDCSRARIEIEKGVALLSAIEDKRRETIKRGMK